MQALRFKRSRCATPIPVVARCIGPFFILVFCALSLLSQERKHTYPIHYDRRVGQADQILAPKNGGFLPKFHLTFHGGPVQVTTKSFAIYWKPPGSFMDDGYQKIVNQFLNDVGGSPIYGYATEYSGSNGQVRNVSQFGGSWVDTTPFPEKGISDAAIQQSVERAILLNGWPTGVDSSFFVMLGESQQQFNFCAYHSAFEFNGDSVVYGVMPYFTVKTAGGCGTPFGISPNNNFDADSTVGNLTHEQMEMVTDPLLNAWYDSRLGVEVGDVCIYSYGVPFGSKGGNLIANNHEYIIQEEWSEKHKSCQPNL